MSPPTRRKVMAIGLDGLTLDVLVPLMDAGRLPTFARLLGEGAWGPLRSVTNTMTGPTWVSFATGSEPARHGVLHDYHHEAGAYALHRTTGADVRLPGLWSVASEAGRRVIVLNVPHTFPAPPVNGVLLAGIDAPAPSAPGFDHPPGAYRRLVRATGDYLIDCGCEPYLRAARAGGNERAIAAAVAAVVRETEGRTRAAEHYLASMDWDLFVVSYSLPDIWQHYFWHTIGGAADVPGSGLVASGYETIDRHVERLIAHLPPDGVLVVFSDHGFGPATGSLRRLNDWLRDRGLLAYRRDHRQRAERRLFTSALGAVRRHTSYGTRQRLLSTLPMVRRAVETRLHLGDIDWSGTRAYAAIDHLEVWLNLHGRQPQGTVAVAEAGALLDRLRDDLLAWRNPATGLAYVRAVHLRPYESDVPTDGIAPDLAIEWDPAAAPPDAHPTMTGDHDPVGTIVVWGRPVRPGRFDGASLTGVAGFLLGALGVPAAEWMAPPVAIGLAGDVGEGSDHG